MSGWLPRIEWGGWCMCDSPDETYEGWRVSVFWGGFIVEFAFGRREQVPA
jgi:hypothetical protein